MITSYFNSVKFTRLMTKILTEKPHNLLLIVSPIDTLTSITFYLEANIIFVIARLHSILLIYPN